MAEPSECTPLTSKGNHDGVDLLKTVFNMINCFVGAGILTVPFAFRMAGYGAVLCLGFVAGLVWTTSLLLGKSIDKAAKLHPEVRTSSWDVPAVARLAFGPIGEQVIRFTFALELWFALETFIVLTGINVNLVCGVPKTLVIVVAGCLGTASLSLPVSVIAGVSFLSIWCMAGGLLALVYCGHRTKVETSHVLLDVHGLPAAVGIFLYCFSGLPCLPNIRAAMRRPAEYPLAVHYTFVFSLLYYGVVGLLGYYYYAAGTKESFTENFFEQPGLPGTSLDCLAALASAALFAMKLQAGFPLYAAPILGTFGVGSQQAEEVPGRVWVARVAFAAVSICFAIFAQDAVDHVAELMGAFLSNFTSIIFPCAAYLALCHESGERLGVVRAGGLWAIMISGMVFGAVGTWTAVRTIKPVLS